LKILKLYFIILQRNLLWKAGWVGGGKPSLLGAETGALGTALRILFRMYEREEEDVATVDEGGKGSEVEVRLSGVVRGALEHFLLLPSHAHRDAWTNLLLLTITKLLKLPEPRVRKLTKIWSIKFRNFMRILKIILVFRNSEWFGSYIASHPFKSLSVSLRMRQNSPLYLSSHS
jgi:hypothetical protein